MQAVQEHREELAAAEQQLQAHARELLKDGMTVITTSYSSTIRDALTQASKGEHSWVGWLAVAAWRRSCCCSCGRVAEGRGACV